MRLLKFFCLKAGGLACAPELREKKRLTAEVRGAIYERDYSLSKGKRKINRRDSQSYSRRETQRETLFQIKTFHF